MATRLSPDFEAAAQVDPAFAAGLSPRTLRAAQNGGGDAASREALLRQIQDSQRAASSTRGAQLRPLPTPDSVNFDTVRTALGTVQAGAAPAGGRRR